MDLGIRDRVAMVAASTKGLGRATAIALAKEGCHVSICGRHEETLRSTKEELQRLDVRVHASICDVSKAEELERWHRETVEALGEVDILVTNTGGPPAARFLDLKEEQWRNGIESTLMNVIRLCNLTIPSMQRKKWGRIVHITSLVAKQPMDLLTISSTLRAGISALTKTMSNQLAPDNILVNALLPGHILTDRQIHLAEVRAKEQGKSVDEVKADGVKAIPLARYGRPEEIGEAIAFLCSERAGYITGVSLQVDGGIIQSTF